MQIKTPQDIFETVKKYRNKRQEHFLVITLSAVHDVIRTHVVSIGVVNKTVVHPREVFWHAIKDNAATVAIVHNHPSGRVEPSEEDNVLTRHLCKAAKILGFHVVDHVIIAKDSYYSYQACNPNTLVVEGDEFSDMCLGASI